MRLKRGTAVQYLPNILCSCYSSPYALLQPWSVSASIVCSTLFQDSKLIFALTFYKDLPPRFKTVTHYSASKLQLLAAYWLLSVLASLPPTRIIVLIFAFLREKTSLSANSILAIASSTPHLTERIKSAINIFSHILTINEVIGSFFSISRLVFTCSLIYTVNHRKVVNYFWDQQAFMCIFAEYFHCEASAH